MPEKMPVTVTITIDTIHDDKGKFAALEIGVAKKGRGRHTVKLSPPEVVALNGILVGVLKGAKVNVVQEVKGK